MKKIITLLFFVITAISFAKAQDILIKKNGEELKVKITEVKPTEVVFRYFDNLEGPLYVVSKSEVFMIKYANGNKEIISEPTTSGSSSKASRNSGDGISNGLVIQKGSRYYINKERISEAELLEKMRDQNNQAALKMWNQSISEKRTSKIFIIAGIPLASVGIGGILWGVMFKLEGGFGSSQDEDDAIANTFLTIGGVGLVAGGASIIYGTVLNGQAKTHKASAIKLYNEEVRRSH